MRVRVHMRDFTHADFQSVQEVCHGFEEIVLKDREYDEIARVKNYDIQSIEVRPDY